MNEKPLPFPPGHFYSPVVDPEEIVARAGQLWPTAINDPLGIDFNAPSHIELLREIFPKYIANYSYPDHGSEVQPTTFYTQNSQFSWLDSRAYFVLLQHYRPKRVVEVGAGFSTLLLNDVNLRFLGGMTEITCIEPYPREFLYSLPQVGLIRQKVQDVSLSTFESLDEGDILFIDSSHVAKTGSDVNFLYFEILPRLRRGVLVHIHDIFLPDEYPKAWVIGENRSWNEQYVVRALLMYSSMFRVIFGCCYAFIRYPDLVRQALALTSGAAFGGGSLWICKER
jgi:hypothetical protein